MNHILLTIYSRRENVPVAGACLKEFAAEYFSVEKLTEIEQALAETINNCIEHAYSGSEVDQISIGFTLSDDSLSILITDHGKPFDADRLANLNMNLDYDPLDIENLPEGGFGLFVINRSMDEISYRREDGKNYWTLKKFVS